MDEPIWIGKELAVAVHQRQLAEHGGLEGVRDEGMLESALGRPRQKWAYDEPKPSVAALAGAYAYGIARNHPFVDGNKRTAAVVCETFLMLNGWRLTAGDEEMYLAFVRLAAGEVGEGEFVAWVEGNARRG